MHEEKVFYNDPSAAHERALRFKTAGAYRVTIEPRHGVYWVTAWFYSKPRVRNDGEYND